VVRHHGCIAFVIGLIKCLKNLIDERDYSFGVGFFGGLSAEFTPVFSLALNHSLLSKSGMDDHFQKARTVPQPKLLIAGGSRGARCVIWLFISGIKGTKSPRHARSFPAAVTIITSPVIESQAFDVLRGPEFFAYFSLMGRLQSSVEERNSVEEKSRATRILVVDDNPAVRRYLRGVLEQHRGWRVCDEARDGQEAVYKFQKIKPDVIVLDFQMPYMNGLDAARAISQLSPETPILMVTLYLTKQLSEEAQKAGVRGTCSKTDLLCVVDAVGALLREETYFQV
jgi:CheY-like chemotaxis protein